MHDSSMYRWELLCDSYKRMEMCGARVRVRRVHLDFGNTCGTLRTSFGTIPETRYNVAV